LVLANRRALAGGSCGCDCVLRLRLRLRFVLAREGGVWWQMMVLWLLVMGWLLAVLRSVWLCLRWGRGFVGVPGWGGMDRCCSVWGAGRAVVACDRTPPQALQAWVASAAMPGACLHACTLRRLPLWGRVLLTPAGCGSGGAACFAGGRLGCIPARLGDAYVAALRVRRSHRRDPG
jgi:hypothetical protein